MLESNRKLLLIVYIACASVPLSHAEDSKQPFELDCINFAGRALSAAPVKKKVQPGLAADGTAWSIGTDKRVVITHVFPGEAAEKAGIKVGDEVVTINGYPLDGSKPHEIFCAYHMYNPDTLNESITIQKADGTKQTVKLQVLPLDKCAQEEKIAWLDLYKLLGY